MLTRKKIKKKKQNFNKTEDFKERNTFLNLVYCHDIPFHNSYISSNHKSAFFSKNQSMKFNSRKMEREKLKINKANI